MLRRYPWFLELPLTENTGRIKVRRFKNILFIADNGPGQGQAFSRALQLASENNSELTLMSVVDDLATMLPYPLFMEGLEFDQQNLVEARRSSLERLIDEQAEHFPGVPTRIDVREGRLFIEVIQAVLNNNHDLVMKAAYADPRPLGKVLGGTDIKLLRKCPCPIWAVKQSARKHFARILAAVDPDPGNPDAESLNTLILELATSLAEMEKSELDVLHAWEVHGEVALRSGRLPRGALNRILDEMQAAHQKQMDELLAPYDAISKNVHLVKGDAGEAIIELADKNNVDLIVMGTVGRSGIPGLITGNTAERVINGIDCSVLAVKPEGFVSPVTM